MTQRDDTRYAFEQVPRGQLAFKANRRKFLPSLLVEIQAFNKKADGGAVLKLADLGNCSDEELAGIIPVIVPGCEISLINDSVYARPPDAIEPFELFPVGTPALKVFNLFNGFNTLDEACYQLLLETDWEIPRAFAYVRGVFLWLVLAGVCRPAGY